MPWPDSADMLAPLAPWFKRVKRAMPWRNDDLDAPHPDPYAVLVSELMLQQTQVATVIPYFERWMARFPDARSLAEANEEVTHKAWEGLGYYRRCRFLKAAATEIAAKGWPSDLEGLTVLPGLGPYTAAALGAIAFQWPTPALDGNAFRVLARLLLIEGDPKKEAAALRAWLAPALEILGPSRITQAIMELGATTCLPQPRCGSCPLSGFCAAREAGRAGEIPPIAKRTTVKEEALWLIAFEAEGAFLLHPPAEKGLLAGLWRWPTQALGLRDMGLGAAESPLPHLTVEAMAWDGWVQVYTHRREAVSPLRLKLSTRFEAEGMRWVPASELESLPLGRRDGRFRDLLKTEGQTPLDLPFEVLQFIR
ncbi:MAG: A/G-specific adenine glycosylase [Acidobacteria bacterium]|nr:A/G-specific adenine glycosylase [Acidobacteriota bacterium]